MIGRGLIVIRREPDKNELHEIDPWQLGHCLTTARSGKEGKSIEDFNQETLLIARRDAWEPEDVVTDAEVEEIKSANCGAPVEALNIPKGCEQERASYKYHPWASDIVHVIDLVKAGGSS